MSITAEEAQERYDALGKQDWRAASLWGIALALEHVLEVELLRAFRREARARAGINATASEGLPQWVMPALAEVLQAPAAGRPVVPLLDALHNPEFQALLLELERSGSVRGWLSRMNTLHRHRFEQAVMPSVLRRHDPRVAAQHSELVAFYRGVRIQFHVAQLGEPKPSELRWLAAARAIEPIEGSVDAARKLWEDRLRRWRPKMDREWAGWRDVMDRVLPRRAAP